MTYMIRPRIEYYDLDKIIDEAPMKKGKNILEKKVKEEDLGEGDGKGKSKTEKIEPVEFNLNLTKSDYVHIPKQEFVTAIAETDFNLNYEEVHKAVLKKGLAVPEISQFMTFHNYIIDCYKNKKQIFDAGGNPLSNKIKNDLYKQLTENCWTWLNGLFHLSGDKKTIEKVIGLDSNDILLTKREDLENYLEKDCYVDFIKLNKQGIPNSNAKFFKQDFVEGKNIYFYQPVDERVARFYADSDRAYLYCCRDSSGRGSSLGVRAVGTNKVLLAGEIK